jgi:hypothetical protein
VVPSRKRRKLDGARKEEQLVTVTCETLLPSWRTGVLTFSSEKGSLRKEERR